MEEKKKVYVRGHKGREQEVVDVLIGLGANALKDEYADSDDYLYFINHDNEIGVALINSEVGAIIMDNYKEIELPQRPWKDGDILVRADRNGKEFVVFERFDDDDFFYHYPLFHGDSTDPLPVENYRKALSNEVRMFKELLASYGKEWDEEQKRVVRKVFQPANGETYYRIISSGNVVFDIWGGKSFQLEDRSFGNCFKTRMEAVRAARKIRALLHAESEEDREK